MAENNYTEKTRQWLENRFSILPGGAYDPHAPVHGLDEYSNEHGPDQTMWLTAKTIQVMRYLSRTSFKTLLDVGAAEGYTARLSRHLFGCDVTAADISLQAMLRCGELFAIPGTALNASNLPFRDDSFDAVICNECIEHVENPFELLLDAARVARRCLIVSTAEARVCYLAAKLALSLLDPDETHGHISVWCRRDFTCMFGSKTVMSCQNFPRPWDDLPPEELFHRVTVLPPDQLGEGIIVAVYFDESARLSKPVLDDDTIIRSVTGFAMDKKPLISVPDDTAPADTLIKRLLCPLCRTGRLSFSTGKLTCCDCGQTFDVRGGVPDMYVKEPADIKKLAFHPKLSREIDGKKRLKWAKKRQKQFNTKKYLKNEYLLKKFRKLVPFIDFWYVQPGFWGKFRFALTSVLPKGLLKKPSWMQKK